MCPVSSQTTRLFSRPSVSCFKPEIQMRMPPFKTQGYDKNCLIAINAQGSAPSLPTATTPASAVSNSEPQIHKVPASADTTPNRTPHHLHFNDIINLY